MTQEILYVYLKNHPLFSNTTEQMIKDTSEKMKVKTVYRGESFGYGEGSYSKIYLLLKGKVKIAELNSDSNELIKDILTSPDIFGDLRMDGAPDADEYAEALMANTVVCMMNSGDLKKMLTEIPGMAMAYANMVSSKLKKMETRHADLVFYDARARLIRFIKNWAHADGNRVGDKIILNNYLTHTDIANVIATSRQSVNFLLNELRDAGFILYNRKQIQLNTPLMMI
jgi:CRP/FNR family transcriptional regulator, cyclic AMP receptor protein